MVLAWMFFAATGMFFARYQKPTFGERRLIGEKVWFQVSTVQINYSIPENSNNNEIQNKLHGYIMF